MSDRIHEQKLVEGLPPAATLLQALRDAYHPVTQLEIGKKHDSGRIRSESTSSSLSQPLSELSSDMQRVQVQLGRRTTFEEQLALQRQLWQRQYKTESGDTVRIKGYLTIPAITEQNEKVR